MKKERFTREQFTREQFVRPDDETIDPKAYMKEFDFSSAGRENPGDSTGYMRFVSFKTEQDEPIMVADCHLSPTFEQGMIGLFSQNDTVFQKMKRMIETAELVRKGMPLEIAAIGYKIGLFDDDRKSGGFLEFLSNILNDDDDKKPKNPIDEILSDTMESGNGRRRRGTTAKIISGTPGELAGILRKMFGGDGCHCAECTAEREAAKNKPKPNVTDDPTAN